MWISEEYPHGYSRDRNQPWYVIRKPVWLVPGDQRRGRNLSPRMNREQLRKMWMAALRTWAGILPCCNRKLWQSCEQSNGIIWYISSGLTRNQTLGGKGLKLQGLRGGPCRILREGVCGNHTTDTNEGDRKSLTSVWTLKVGRTEALEALDEGRWEKKSLKDDSL